MSLRLGLGQKLLLFGRHLLLLRLSLLLGLWGVYFDDSDLVFLLFFRVCLLILLVIDIATLFIAHE